MTDKLLESAIAQVPALALVVSLVIAFLRHLCIRDRLLKGLAKDCHEKHAELTASVLVANEKVVEALCDNCKMLGKVSTELQNVHDHLVRVRA